MKKRTKIIAAAALAVCMVFSMTACGSKGAGSTGGNSDGTAAQTSSDAADSTGLSVGIVVKTATNAHFQDIAYGAMLAGHDLGLEVKVDNTTTETDVEGQITKCENLISAGVDALILTANDSISVGAAVDAAHDAGIPFVAADTEIVNQWGDDVKEYLPNFVGEDYQQLAYEMGKVVCEKLGGKGNVVIIRGIDAASSSQQRTAGYEQAIAEYPDITIVDSQSANFDQDTAAMKMANIVQAHSDIDAVLCDSDLMACGAITALKENGKTVSPDGGVIVCGLDGNILALESIKDGEMFGTLYDWSVIQGYEAVAQAYDLIQGKEVPETTLTIGTVITADNVDEYIPHGNEIVAWQMGSKIETVSDDMRAFVDNGYELNGLPAR